MTRKRFIKLVMSLGISRNSAVEMTKEVISCGSYESLFATIPNRSVASAMNIAATVTKACSEAFETVSRGCQQICFLINRYADNTFTGKGSDK